MSKKLNRYRPTANLRFVRRKLLVECDGSTPAHPAAIVKIITVLQQKFESDYVGEEPQWLDVPVENEKQ